MGVLVVALPMLCVTSLAKGPQLALDSRLRPFPSLPLLNLTLTRHNLQSIFAACSRIAVAVAAERRNWFSFGL